MPKVLILGLYYPPANFMAGRRLEGWARHLPAFGYEPLVLTRYYDPEERNSQDFYASARPTRTLATGWVEAEGVVHTNFTPGRFSRLPLPGKVRGVAHFLWPDPEHSCWLRQCTEYFASSAFRPDIVIASYGPPGVFRVGRKLSEQFGCPWVADFRDLWIPQNGTHAATGLKLSLQRRHLRTAAGATVVTDGMAETVRAQLAPLSKEVRAIYNGAEPVAEVEPDAEDAAAVAAFREVRAHHRIVLTYTGTLYPEQSIEKFLRVVAGFNAKHGRDSCAVVLCGKHDPELYAAWKFVKVLGTVGHRTSLFLQRESAASFYLTWPPGYSIFSGKIFEMMLSGKPALVGFSPAPDLESLCRKFETVSLFREPIELERALERLLSGGWSSAPGEVPAVATKKYWAGELARFLDALLERRREKQA
jgi:hypothetical protein